MMYNIIYIVQLYIYKSYFFNYLGYSCYIFHHRFKYVAEISYLHPFRDPLIIDLLIIWKR